MAVQDAGNLIFLMATVVMQWAKDGERKAIEF
jgi:hypothetical protein